MHLQSPRAHWLGAALAFSLLGGCGATELPTTPLSLRDSQAALHGEVENGALHRALEALGGRRALSRLRTLRVEVSGTRYFPGEEFAVGEPAPRSNVYTGTLQFDVEHDASRFDVQRTLTLYGASVSNTFSELVHGDLGTVVGSDSLFGAPGTDLLPAGTAALRKERRLTNPFLLLREVLATPALAQDGGPAVVDGVLYHRLVVQSAVQPITLYVEARSGRLSKLTTRENDHLFRDTDVSVEFAGWRASEAGLRFPTRVTLLVDGRVIASEERSVPSTGVAIDPAALAFPAGAAPVYAEADAAFGERDFHFHTVFASFGFRLDPVQTFVDAVQLSPGVFVLGGASHKSMAVEQAAGVVIIESPLYAERSQAVLGWAARQFPGKPVSHVVVTHFHDDHSGGLRDFVAAGATVVCGSGSEGYYERALAAPSTIVPDALALSPRPTTIVRVAPAGSTELPDATNPVSVQAISNSHASDMVIVRLPRQNIVFESDLFSPGFPPGVLPSINQVELHRALAAGGHTTDLIVGGHGGNASFADLEAALP